METGSSDFAEIYPTIAFAMHSFKLVIIGVLMFGLLIGSLYFCYFLYKTWRLPR